MRYVPERCAIVEFGRRLYKRGLIAGPEGNLTVRVADGFLCTPSGASKGFLSADRVLLVSDQGRVIEGEGRPTSELSMHLAIYRARPDVGAIVHAHPPHALAFALTAEAFPEGVLSEVEVLLGPVAVVPYALPGSEELGRLVASSMPPPTSTALLQSHGAVTLGTSLEDAWKRMEVLEAACRGIWLAQQLGDVRKLPPDAVARLRQQYTF